MSHKFAYGAGKYMTCVCGAEQDVVLHEGKATRLYRTGAAAAWSEVVAPCSKRAALMPPLEPKAQADPEATTRFAAALQSAYPEAFAPEIIDGDNVDDAAAMVDLSIAFTPVLATRDSMCPADVAELDGGRYRVFGEQTLDISAASLKVMRARYLLTRSAIVRRLPTMGDVDRRRIERAFWPRGDVPWVPPAGSPLAEQLATGEPIVIQRDGDGDVDIVAVFNALATPGEKVPDVCPTLPKEMP